MKVEVRLPSGDEVLGFTIISVIVSLLIFLVVSFYNDVQKYASPAYQAKRNAILNKLTTEEKIMLGIRQ